MARSLARSTERAALRLLSSLRRFLFDLVMVPSLHQLRCYHEEHGSPPSLPRNLQSTNCLIPRNYHRDSLIGRQGCADDG